MFSREDADVKENQITVTYHCLYGNRLNEAGKDLGKSARAHPCPADLAWVLLHALLPVIAYLFHGWHPTFTSAFVFLEFTRADGHFGQGLRSDFSRFQINIGTDGRPEAVDDVHQEGNDEDVEHKLCVPRKDMRQIGMFLNVTEKGWYEANISRPFRPGRLRGLLLLLLLLLLPPPPLRPLMRPFTATGPRARF